jgi:hypothetical protein
VHVPSSELGFPQPLFRKRVCPPPRTKGWGGGGHTRLRLRGSRSSNSAYSDDWRKSLAICLLCVFSYVFQICAQGLCFCDLGVSGHPLPGKSLLQVRRSNYVFSFVYDLYTCGDLKNSCSKFMYVTKAVTLCVKKFKSTNKTSSPCIYHSIRLSSFLLRIAQYLKKFK